MPNADFFPVRTSYTPKTWELQIDGIFMPVPLLSNGIFIPFGIIIISAKEMKGGESTMKKQTREDLMGLAFMFLLLMTAVGVRAYIWL